MQIQLKRPSSRLFCVRKGVLAPETGHASPCSTGLHRRLGLLGLQCGGRRRFAGHVPGTWPQVNGGRRENRPVFHRFPIGFPGFCMVLPPAWLLNPLPKRLDRRSEVCPCQASRTPKCRIGLSRSMMPSDTSFEARKFDMLIGFLMSC